MEKSLTRYRESGNQLNVIEIEITVLIPPIERQNTKFESDLLDLSNTPTGDNKNNIQEAFPVQYISTIIFK